MSKFCPSCGFFLIPNDKDGELVDKCTACDYVSPPKEGSQTVFTKKYTASTNTFNKLSWHFSQDPTLRRTSHPCQNKSCATHKTGKYELASYTKNTDAVLGFICTTCKYRW